MRTAISLGRPGWIYRLDYKKLIIIAFLFRLILASGYDVFTCVTNRDLLVPDGRFYSTVGCYAALLLNGYDKGSFTEEMMPIHQFNRKTFYDVYRQENKFFKSSSSSHESAFYYYVVGIIYFIFGYFPLAVRIFNIILSIGSTYLIFIIAKRQFGDLTANLFLLIALFLPTQVMYSVTLARDFLRMFVISLILWLIYGGVLWQRKQRM